MYYLFGKDDCRASEEARELFKQYDLYYAYINLDYEPKKMEKLKRNGLNETPVIFGEDGYLIGSLFSLKKHLKHRFNKR